MKNFNERLTKLATEATAFLFSLLKDKKEIILAHPENEDFEDNIYDLPECAIYNKHGFEDFAKIYKITISEIPGQKPVIIFNTFTNEGCNHVETNYGEVEDHYIIMLASYLQNNN